MNKGYAMGFISSDIKEETINLKNGEQMTKATFSVACSRKSKDGGADFIYFIAFGKNADNIIRYFEKGKGIFLEYHIQTSSFDGKDGQKVFRTDMIVDAFEFPPVRRSEEPQQNGGGLSFGERVQKQPQEPVNASKDGFMNIPDNIADDLPFR